MSITQKIQSFEARIRIGYCDYLSLVEVVIYILLGTLLAGWLGEKSGLRALVAAGATAMLLAALWLSLSAVRRAATPEPKTKVLA